VFVFHDDSANSVSIAGNRSNSSGSFFVDKSRTTEAPLQALSLTLKPANASTTQFLKTNNVGASMLTPIFVDKTRHLSL
jgi:hypothetical protein